MTIPRPAAATAAAVLLGLCLAGCAGAGGYPSLAARPAETRGWAEPVPPLPAPVAPDAALDARIATGKASLASSAAAFSSTEGRAARLVADARGAAAGSERWIAAQSALAELDAAHAATGEAASTMEDLAATRAQALEPDYPPLETARAAAGEQSQAETARIRTLGNALLPG